MTNSNGVEIMDNEVGLARDGIRLVDEMYDSVDRLNGVLDDLLNLLDRDSAEWRALNDFYINFPTYHSLDDIKETFRGLKGEK
jgi:hypothetical protein